MQVGPWAGQDRSGIIRWESCYVIEKWLRNWKTNFFKNSLAATVTIFWHLNSFKEAKIYQIIEKWNHYYVQFCIFLSRKNNSFFIFFFIFQRFFFMLLLDLKQKNSFYLVWKKQVCGMFDYAGGCIITSFVDITFFCFAISFLSSLSFKVLNWSKLSSDTSRLNPISIRSRLETFYRSRLGSEWRRKAMRPMFSQTDSNCFCKPHLKERKQKTLKKLK